MNSYQLPVVSYQLQEVLVNPKVSSFSHCEAN